jgi:ribosomal protein S18 acetylase RimI-like enzyme
MSEIILRNQLRQSDREAIDRILRETGAFREEEIAIGLELVDESLQPGPSTDYQWWFAERHAQVLGFACFGPVPLTEGTFDLYWIAILPEARGAGVADRLDGAVTDSVRKVGGRLLLAETSSTAPYEAARRFYRRRGYDLLERIADFYRVGDDRLTFGKRLNRSE